MWCAHCHQLFKRKAALLVIAAHDQIGHCGAGSGLEVRHEVGLGLGRAGIGCPVM